MIEGMMTISCNNINLRKMCVITIIAVFICSLMFSVKNVMADEPDESLEKLKAQLLQALKDRDKILNIIKNKKQFSPQKVKAARTRDIDLVETIKNLENRIKRKGGNPDDVTIQFKKQKIQVGLDRSLRAKSEGVETELKTPRYLRPWQCPPFLKELRITVLDRNVIELHDRYSKKKASIFFHARMKEEEKTIKLKHGEMKEDQAYNPLNTKDWEDMSAWKDFEAKKLMGSKTIFFIHKDHPERLKYEKGWLIDLKNVNRPEKLCEEYNSLQDTVRAQLLTINDNFTDTNWEKLRIDLKKLFPGLINTEKKIFWLLGSTYRATPAEKKKENGNLAEVYKLLKDPIPKLRREVIRLFRDFKYKELYVDTPKPSSGSPGGMTQAEAERRQEEAKDKFDEADHKYSGGVDKKTKTRIVGLVEKAEGLIANIEKSRNDRAMKRAEEVKPVFRVHDEFETPKEGEIRIKWGALIPFVKDNKKCMEQLNKRINKQKQRSDITDLR